MNKVYKQVCLTCGHNFKTLLSGNIELLEALKICCVKCKGQIVLVEVSREDKNNG
jgi:hypothetical protein